MLHRLFDRTRNSPVLHINRNELHRMRFSWIEAPGWPVKNIAEKELRASSRMVKQDIRSSMINTDSRFLESYTLS